MEPGNKNYDSHLHLKITTKLTLNIQLLWINSIMKLKESLSFKRLKSRYSFRGSDKDIIDNMSVLKFINFSSVENKFVEFSTQARSLFISLHEIELSKCIRTTRVHSVCFIMLKFTHSNRWYRLDIFKRVH